MERRSFACSSRDLGGGGNSDPDVDTPVLHQRHSLVPAQPLSRMVEPLMSPLPYLSLGRVQPEVLHGDIGNAQLNNMQITLCAKPQITCS